jgi:hypothetical protein
MIPILLKYWQPILAAGASLLVSYGAHKVVMMYVNSQHEIALATLEVDMTKKCKEAQAITREVSDEYQSQISALNRRVADLKRLRAQCVPVYADPTGGHNGASTGELRGPDGGITAGTLLDFARDAEQTRLQLIGCQDWIRKVEDLN